MPLIQSGSTLPAVCCENDAVSTILYIHGANQVIREYQFGFSRNNKSVYDVVGRERKAKTIVKLLESYLTKPLDNYSVLNAGGSAGIINNYLADFFDRVVGTDIDEDAIKHASMTYSKNNLEFHVADAMNLPFEDESFDVIICSYVYEHVPDAGKMFDE